MALIEALILNVPVISTDCPVGPREILRGSLTRYLVPVQDISALAKALDNTLNEIALNNYIIDMTLLDKFDADHACGQYMALAEHSTTGHSITG